jgi:hypothetical protein
MARFEKREGRRRTGRSRLRQEHKRLLTEGEKGIQVSLDPEFVQRVRELDELEGKVGVERG